MLCFSAGHRDRDKSTRRRNGIMAGEPKTDGQNDEQEVTLPEKVTAKDMEGICRHFGIRILKVDANTFKIVDPKGKDGKAYQNSKKEVLSEIVVSFDAATGALPRTNSTFLRWARVTNADFATAYPTTSQKKAAKAAVREAKVAEKAEEEAAKKVKEGAEAAAEAGKTVSKDMLFSDEFWQAFEVEDLETVISKATAVKNSKLNADRIAELEICLRVLEGLKDVDTKAGEAKLKEQLDELKR
jgi:hypothetical protein